MSLLVQKLRHIHEQHSFCTTLNCMMYFQADNFSTYNRLFHQRNGYDSKIHRDDRNHILKIGRAVHDEVSVIIICWTGISHILRDFIRHLKWTDMGKINVQIKQILLRFDC